LEGYLNGHYNTDYYRSIILPEAQPVLLAELSVDPFWIVRCAIIQVLEKISDPEGALATVNIVFSTFCS
jgi:hypothetical protein